MATIRGGISEGIKLFQMKHAKDKICTALLAMAILVGSVLFTGCDKEGFDDCPAPSLERVIAEVTEETRPEDIAQWQLERECVTGVDIKMHYDPTNNVPVEFIQVVIMDGSDFRIYYVALSQPLEILSVEN